MSNPTNSAIIGQFSNSRGLQDDFLQLVDPQGGNIFAWIDYQGHLQGAFLSGITTFLFQDMQPALVGNYNSGLSKVLSSTQVAGLYRVSFFQSINQAASSSSTAPDLTLFYTDGGGISRTQTLFFTDSSNSTASISQGDIVIYSQAASPISVVSSSYSSSGVVQMRYGLAIQLDLA